MSRLGLFVTWIWQSPSDRVGWLGKRVKQGDGKDFSLAVMKSRIEAKSDVVPLLQCTIRLCAITEVIDSVLPVHVCWLSLRWTTDVENQLMFLCLMARKSRDRCWVVDDFTFPF